MKPYHRYLLDCLDDKLAKLDGQEIAVLEDNLGELLSIVDELIEQNVLDIGRIRWKRNLTRPYVRAHYCQQVGAKEAA